jgi:hypothetical protein
LSFEFVSCFASCFDIRILYLSSPEVKLYSAFSCKLGRCVLYVMSIMQRKFYLALLFFTILFSANLYAQGNSPLQIEGEKVDYLIDEGFVIAIDNASVLYKNIKIFADRIEINVDKEELVATPNVHYVKDENTVNAKYLFYNMKNDTGYFEDISKSYFPPWYWKGKRIDILSEDKFILSRGYFTTCDHDPPHYRLSCTSATLKMEEKATSKNVIFHLDGIPLFYFPYYYTYLKYTPYGLVNWVGYSEEKGWMDLAHYNWYVNDNFRGRVYLDYIENVGWGEGFDIDLKTEYGKNYIYGYYMDEYKDFYEEENIKRRGGTGENRDKRWKGVFKHRQEWEGNWASIMQIERFSDRNFNKDFYSEERNKGWASFPLSRVPESYFSLEKVRPDDNTVLYINNGLNDFENLIERKPSITFSTRQQKIEGVPFFYKLETNYSQLEEVFPEVEDVNEDTELERVDILGKLSSPHKIGNWLVSEPYLTIEGTGYSENINGDEVFRNTEKVGWDFRTKLVRPYGETQHIFQPQIGYYYRPEPSIPRDELIRLDPVDRITSQNGVFVEILNRLKTPKTAEVKEYTPSDELKELYARENESQEELLASSIRTYEKKFKEPLNLRIFSNYSLEDNQWENVFIENILRPAEGLSLVSDATYTPEKRWFEIINSTLGISRWEKCGGSLGVSYYRERNIYYGNSKIWFNLPLDCRVQLSTTYDINNDFFRRGGVYIKKPLHCWTAEFQVNSFKRTKDEDYEFEIFFALSITEASGFKIPFSRSIKPTVDEQ